MEKGRAALTPLARGRRLHAIALGCQMSAADAVEMSAPIHARGFSRAASLDEADVVLLSTCTVRQHAEDRALSLIGRLRSWKEAAPGRVLIVAGCAAQRLEATIGRRYPWVDLVAGALSIERFPETVARVLGERFDGLEETARAFPGPPGTGSPAPRNEELVSARALVTIMRGCNYSCSYCIVPAVRGREVYRPLGAILDEARRWLDAGAKELLLLGQTVNSWRRDEEGRTLRFADLLRRLDALPGLERLRFMSPHPYYADDGMLRAMADCPSVCEALHLPVQSGSDRILRLMRRNYTVERFMRTVERARALLPRVVFSTDIIVGFPTETERDFEATLRLVSELAPASAYTFKYSPREGTEAADRPDDVPRGVKEERLVRLNELVDRLAASALRAQAGRRVSVLCEQPGFGRTRDGFKVRCDRRIAAGRTVPVLIRGAARRFLNGEVINELQEQRR